LTALRLLDHDEIIAFALAPGSRQEGQAAPEELSIGALDPSILPTSHAMQRLLQRQRNAGCASCPSLDKLATATEKSAPDASAGAGFGASSLAADARQ